MTGQAEPTAQPTLATTIIATLRGVQASDGDNAAYQIAARNIAASTRFIFEEIGPQAARRAVLATAEALERDIKTANGNSEWMQ
jgi:hypothetical protein